MILMSNAMMGAAGGQSANGATHPNLLLAFPFWLGSGYVEMVSGDTCSTYGIPPVADACGMQFVDGHIETNETIAPGAMSVVARVDASTPEIFCGIISDKRVVYWDSQTGFSMNINRDRLFVSIGLQIYYPPNLVAGMRDCAFSFDYISPPKVFIDSEEVQHGNSSVPLFLKSDLPTQIGSYYGGRVLGGCAKYIYVFNAALSSSEIADIHANPESVL